MLIIRSLFDPSLFGFFFIVKKNDVLVTAKQIL